MLSRTTANLNIPAFDDNPSGMTAKGNSAFFMQHPANDRSWPKVAAHVHLTGVSFGHIAAIE
jgi:hypothetical protein